MISISQVIFPSLKREDKTPIFQEILDKLNNPEKKLPTINIVGTNGKGSTSFYISQGLKTKYKKVGLFISPAFLYHNERIQINNVPISDEELKLYIEKVSPFIQEYQMNFFET